MTDVGLDGLRITGETALIRLRALLRSLVQLVGISIAGFGVALLVVFVGAPAWLPSSLASSWFVVSGLGNTTLVVAGLLVAWWPSRANVNLLDPYNR